MRWSMTFVAAVVLMVALLVALAFAEGPGGGTGGAGSPGPEGGGFTNYPGIEHPGPAPSRPSIVDSNSEILPANDD